jgi:nitroreductase
MEFSTLVKTRRSVRLFNDREVSDEQILKLLEAARWAPSGGNCQPWYFYVIKNRDLISKINQQVYTADWILSAPVLIVVCADIPRSESRYHERGRDLYCIQDTAAAVQNILLSATDNGLATCWVGAFDEDKCTKLLNLEAGMRPVAIIPVGYSDSEPKIPRRRPIEDIATFLKD